MSDLISYTSKFDKKTKVYLVDNTFSGYETLKDKFETHGLGFAIPEKKSVFIDLDKVASDNLTNHHITFIESGMFTDNSDVKDVLQVTCDHGRCS